MPPRARFASFRSLVFSRPAALAAALLTTLIVIGCMSLNISGTGDDPSVLVQTDTLDVPAGRDLEVFYITPYASPPNLVIDDWHNDCVVTEQKENHFRVKNNNASFVRTVRWTARGQRGAVADPPAPPFSKSAPSTQSGKAVLLTPQDLPPDDPPAKILTPR